VKGPPLHCISAAGSGCLDVACGPGNFTSFFADQLAGDGFVIGLDNSVPMIERAVRDNSGARAVYMRGDALDLPFNNRAFDVVTCFAALHLVSQPFGVLHEMVRVLSPGGRIAVMTTYGRESFLLQKALELGATICGVRVFDRTTVPTFFAAACLVDGKWVEKLRSGSSRGRNPADRYSGPTSRRSAVGQSFSASFSKDMCAGPG
jgi:SAM-dependent methyltransferase